MASDNSLIGKQIGNYRILTEINSGSFGTVYQGKHIIFDDDPIVAIKLLRTTLHSQQEHDEFIKEAQILKKLKHPHILRILDAGFQDSVPYLVTEYAAEGSLRDRLKKSNGKPLPLDEATIILTQIGQALHYAHKQHIIHRDLKPENILFNQVGEALLADFGIAVLLASTHTGLVGVGGTPPYMAPEQFEGLASARSDQYSLGCIAYELVTGHRLFTIPNATLEAYWYHHAKVEPTPPSRYQAQIPTHIEQAILTALTKDRAQRHKDITTFSNALLKSSREWITEGAQHYRAKRYEQALAAFEQAISLNPSFTFAHRNKGIVLNSMGKTKEAEQAFEKARQLDHNSELASSQSAAPIIVENVPIAIVKQSAQEPSKTLQGVPKKPNLAAMLFIDGSIDSTLPDGSTLPAEFVLWIGEKFMYLGKYVNGVALRYGNENGTWYVKRNDWRALNRWIEQVRSKWFVEYYGTTNPPTEEQRDYRPHAKVVAANNEK